MLISGVDTHPALLFDLTPRNLIDFVGGLKSPLMRQDGA